MDGSRNGDQYSIYCLQIDEKDCVLLCNLPQKTRNSVVLVAMVIDAKERVLVSNLLRISRNSIILTIKALLTPQAIPARDHHVTPVGLE